jgi:NADH-quinone oxidoreductase subunit J
MENLSGVQIVLGTLLMASSLGTVLAKKPIHATLSFLCSLIVLAAMYLQLSAEFIAVMQVLVYAGAILVLFMFVIVLFQDAHDDVYRHRAKSSIYLIYAAIAALGACLLYVGFDLARAAMSTESIQPEFGSVKAIGQDLYLNFFFPFEAVILLFLIAAVGALYVGKKGV